MKIAIPFIDISMEIITSSPTFMPDVFVADDGFFAMEKSPKMALD